MQNAAQGSADWPRVHHDDSLTDGEETTDQEGHPYSRRLPTRRRGHAHTSAVGNGSDKQPGTIRARRGREPFPITRQFQEVGLRWPSPTKSVGEGEQFDNHRGFSSSLGRSRGSRYRRRRMAEISRGGQGRGGGYSWSPPRTRTGMGPFGGDFPTATAAGSSGSSKLFGPESREDEQGGAPFIHTGDGEYRRHGRWNASRSSDNSSNGGVACHHRPLSPLMLALDPYCGSRTVVRAGTVVSSRDAEAAEHSSRRAASRVRRASEARAITEGHGAAVASSPGRDQLRRKQWRWQGRRQGRWQHTRGGEGSLAGDREDGWMTSGTLLDVQEGERWRDRIRRSLPSVEGMDRELEAIRKADEAMREEQLAQVWGSIASQRHIAPLE